MPKISGDWRGPHIIVVLLIMPGPMVPVVLVCVSKVLPGPSVP